MATVRWTLTATADLQEIEDFVARDSVVYAIRLVNGIVQATERLAEFPASGRIVPEFSTDEIREVLYRSYRLVYVLDGDTATIVRVVHAARDFAAIVDRESWDLSE